MDKLNLVREKSEKVYRYLFGDGTGFTICSTMFKENGRRWLEILARMDLDEAANNKKESRRHCSFEALDPEGDVLASDECMEDGAIKNEMMVSFVRNLTDLEKEVFKGRFIEQMTQEELAKKLNYSRVRITQVEKSIREKFKKSDKS